MQTWDRSPKPMSFLHPKESRQGGQSTYKESKPSSKKPCMPRQPPPLRASEGPCCSRRPVEVLNRGSGKGQIQIHSPAPPFLASPWASTSSSVKWELPANGNPSQGLLHALTEQTYEKYQAHNKYDNCFLNCPICWFFSLLLKLQHGSFPSRSP